MCRFNESFISDRILQRKWPFVCVLLLGTKLGESFRGIQCSSRHECGKQFQSRRSIFLSSSPYEETSDIETLYRKVAAEDPDWYRQFVVDTLGKDASASVDDDSRESKRKVEVQLTNSLESLSSIDQVPDVDPPFSEPDNVKDALRQLDADDELNVKQIAISEEQTLKDELSDMLGDDELTFATMSSTQTNSSEVFDIIGPNNVKTGDDSTGFASVSQAESTMLGSETIIELTNEVFVDSERGAATILNSTGMPNESSTTSTSVLPPTEKDLNDTANPQALKQGYTADNNNEETRVVMFQPQFRRSAVSVPLTTFLTLGYTEKDVRTLKLDALDMIIDEKRAKPKFGVPAGWRSTIPAAEILEPRQAAAAILELDDYASNGGQETFGDLIIDGVHSPIDSTDSDSLVDDRVVFFSDPSGQSWGSVKFLDLAKLGYTERDIESLDPGALNSILIERLSRPRKGIPMSWRLLEDSLPVKILFREQASEFKSNNKSRSSEKVDRPKRKEGTAKAMSGLAGRPQPHSVTDKSTHRRPRVDSGTVKPEARQATGRSQRRQERTGRTDKPIYDGRSSQRQTSQRMNDPPRPDSIFWPDINSFRNMLRDEASLRLRIIGKEYTDLVKQESEWRLNLYEQWLWKLHDGVCEPLVPTRSDRLRKRTGRERSMQPQPPTAAKRKRRY
ncbi:hypothetical protein MPSEU_000256300 [Mayamaea pseudoterrestris]|nr:hypothetical protein MPSEU_000256300 [Mayamaea pseudoterrestris]